MVEANSLMKLKEYDDAVSYRIGCDCMDSEHDLNIWAEMKEDGFPAIYFSGKLHTNLWGNFFKTPLLTWLNNPLNRVTIALKVLFTGEVEMHKEFVLGKENIKGLCIALDEIEEKLS